MRVEVDLHPGDAEYGRKRCKRTKLVAPPDAAHSGAELPDAHRLREAVVRAGAKAAQDLFFVVPWHQHDDRQVLNGANPLTDLETIHLR